MGHNIDGQSARHTPYSWFIETYLSKLKSMARIRVFVIVCEAYICGGVRWSLYRIELESNESNDIGNRAYILREIETCKQETPRGNVSALPGLKINEKSALILSVFFSFEILILIDKNRKQSIVSVVMWFIGHLCLIVMFYDSLMTHYDSFEP